MRTLTVSEAKANFSQLLDDAAAGETVAISRRGKVVAVLSAARARADAGAAIDAWRAERRGVSLGRIFRFGILSMSDDRRG